MGVFIGVYIQLYLAISDLVLLMLLVLRGQFLSNKYTNSQSSDYLQTKKFIYKKN